jgi:hypothetical protein
VCEIDHGHRQPGAAATVSQCRGPPARTFYQLGR